MTPSETSRIDGLWAVIPAGGAGTRLWPLSRSASPKFLHDLTGSGRSLLQATADRLQPIVGPNIMVVTGIHHEDAVREQLPDLLPDNLVAEPSPRNSMAAIGLAAALLERRDPDAVLGSFAADHIIGEPEILHECVREAVAVARAGYVVTIGIQPTYPSTGFGYIQIGASLTVRGAPRAHQVSSFVEKPTEEVARDYLETGEYRWNAGMFVVKAKVLLDLLACYHPAMAASLRDIAVDPARLPELWPSLTSIAIDNAVAEPAASDGRVAVVPGDFSWDDVGDFASLATLLQDTDDTPGLKVLGDRDLVIAQDSTGVVAPHAGRVVVILGVEDVVVVDTADALLVTTRERVQDVKSAVDILKKNGREDLT